MNDEQDTAKLQPLTLDANNERPTANLSALVTRDVLQVLSVFCYIVAGIAVVCTCLPLTVLVRGIVTIFVRKGDMDCVVGFFVAALSMPLVAAGLAIAFFCIQGRTQPCPEGETLQVGVVRQMCRGIELLGQQGIGIHFTISSIASFVSCAGPLTWSANTHGS